MQRAFDAVKSHMWGCPEMKARLALYNCPSRFWPELLHSFVPMIKQRISVRVDHWFPVLKLAGDLVIRDEASTWLLLSRHFRFKMDHHVNLWECTTVTLSNLTDLDLKRVSALPHAGNNGA